MSGYKRPELPSPEEFAKNTQRLKDRLDAHAKHEGITLHRPIPARELASNIRSMNEARADRVEMTEEQRWAREEILIACKSFREGIQLMRDEGKADGFHDSVETFAMGVEEFLNLLGAKNKAERTDALKAMREAINSMDKYRGV